MSGLYLLLGVLLVLALAWKIYQLSRAPEDSALRAVVLCLAAATVAYPFGHPAGVRLVDGIVGAGTAKLVQNIFLLVTVYFLMCFYLFSAADPEQGRRRAGWELLPLVATAVTMTVATLITPAELRGTGYADADMTVTGLALFYLAGGLYLAYVLGVAFVWTWRYSKVSERPLSIGLGIAGTGMAGMALGATVRMVLVLVRIFGGPTVPPLVSAMSLLLAVSIPLFVIGLTYPGVATRTAAIRVSLQHRRIHRQLGPLWTILHDAFPQDALNRVSASRWRDAVRLRGITRQYYRRVIECRDGLVRVSPYLAAEIDGDARADTATIAAALVPALRASRDGDAVGTTAIPVLTPDDDTIESDVRQLVALSDALRVQAA